jgi:hypothetical protein
MSACSPRSEDCRWDSWAVLRSDGEVEDVDGGESGAVKVCVEGGEVEVYVAVRGKTEGDDISIEIIAVEG